MHIGQANIYEYIIATFTAKYFSYIILYNPQKNIIY